MQPVYSQKRDQAEQAESCGAKSCKSRAAPFHQMPL